MYNLVNTVATLLYAKWYRLLFSWMLSVLWRGDPCCLDNWRRAWYNVCVCVCVCACACTFVRVFVNISAFILVHNSLSHIYTSLHTHRCVCTHAHTHAHTHADTHADTHMVTEALVVLWLTLLEMDTVTWLFAFRMALILLGKIYISNYSPSV